MRVTRGVAAFTAFCSLGLLATASDTALARAAAGQLAQVGGSGAGEQRAQDLFYRGFDALEQNRLDEAVRLFEQGLQYSPSNALATYYLAVAHDRRGDLASAVPFYERVVALAPGTGEAQAARERLQAAHLAGGGSLFGTAPARQPERRSAREVFESSPMARESARQDTFRLPPPPVAPGRGLPPPPVQAAAPAATAAQTSYPAVQPPSTAPDAARQGAGPNLRRESLTSFESGSAPGRIDTRIEVERRAPEQTAPAEAPAPELADLSTGMRAAAPAGEARPMAPVPDAAPAADERPARARPAPPPQPATREVVAALPRGSTTGDLNARFLRHVDAGGMPAAPTMSAPTAVPPREPPPRRPDTPAISDAGETPRPAAEPEAAQPADKSIDRDRPEPATAQAAGDEPARDLPSPDGPARPGPEGRPAASAPVVMPQERPAPVERAAPLPRPSIAAAPAAELPTGSTTGNLNALMLQRVGQPEAAPTAAPATEVVAETRQPEGPPRPDPDAAPAPVEAMPAADPAPPRPDLPRQPRDPAADAADAAAPATPGGERAAAEASTVRLNERALELSQGERRAEPGGGASLAALPPPGRGRTPDLAGELARVGGRTAALPLPKDPQTVQLAEGVTYYGDLRDGKPHGTGRITYPDGSVYVGSFRDGERVGHGVLEIAGGYRYEGEFADNGYHGLGELSFPDGSVYVGEFQNGDRTGRGVYWWPSGAKYEGSFEDGEPDGVGTYFHPDGRAETGRWEDGVLVEAS